MALKYSVNTYSMQAYYRAPLQQSLSRLPHSVDSCCISLLSCEIPGLGASPYSHQWDIGSALPRIGTAVYPFCSPLLIIQLTATWAQDLPSCAEPISLSKLSRGWICLILSSLKSPARGPPGLLVSVYFPTQEALFSGHQLQRPITLMFPCKSYTRALTNGTWVKMLL